MTQTLPPPAVLHSIAAAEAHVRSEYCHDLSGTMETVGPHPRYAVTAEPGKVAVISGREGVAALYDGAHEWAVPHSSRFLAQVSGDWFFFVENMPTRRWVADNSLRTAHTATLLVIDADGVRGEYVWERPAEEAAAAPPPGPLPLARLDAIRQHEAWLAAQLDGDAAAMETLLLPGCSWSERDYLSETPGGAILELRDRAATIDHCRRWHAAFAPEQVSVLNRLASEWYVFAEELWTVRPGGGPAQQLRKAVIYAIGAGGGLRAAIGFGTDPAAPGDTPAYCLGQAFWPEAGADGRTPALRRCAVPAPL